MIHLINCVKAIPLPIFHPDIIGGQVYIELFKSPKDSSFLICFPCYIGSLERLNLTEEVINYILDNNIGTYYYSTFLVGSTIPADWVDIYFNNVSTQLLLEEL
jgi:hypothetical protein